MTELEQLEKRVRERNCGWYLKSRRWKQIADNLWMDPEDNSLKDNLEEALKLEVKRHTRNNV